MPKRLRNTRNPADPNKSAFRALERVIHITEAPAKDPAAVALGRRGGLKSGEARMRKIAPARRREIAKHAAEARWGKKRVD